MLWILALVATALDIYFRFFSPDGAVQLNATTELTTTIDSLHLYDITGPYQHIKLIAGSGDVDYNEKSFEITTISHMMRGRFFEGIDQNDNNELSKLLNSPTLDMQQLKKTQQSQGSSKTQTAEDLTKPRKKGISSSLENLNKGPLKKDKTGVASVDIVNSKSSDITHGKTKENATFTPKDQNSKKSKVDKKQNSDHNDRKKQKEKTNHTLSKEKSHENIKGEKTDDIALSKDQTKPASENGTAADAVSPRPQHKAGSQNVTSPNPNSNPKNTTDNASPASQPGSITKDIPQSRLVKKTANRSDATPSIKTNSSHKKLGKVNGSVTTNKDAFTTNPLAAIKTTETNDGVDEEKEIRYKNFGRFFDSDSDAATASVDTGKTRTTFENQNNYPMPKDEDFPTKNIVVSASTIRTDNIYDLNNPPKEKLVDDQNTEVDYEETNGVEAEEKEIRYKNFGRFFDSDAAAASLDTGKTQTSFEDQYPNNYEMLIKTTETNGLKVEKKETVSQYFGRFFDSDAASSDPGETPLIFKNQSYNDHPDAMSTNDKDFPTKNVIVTTSTIRTDNIYVSYNPTEEKLDDQTTEVDYEETNGWKAGGKEIGYKNFGRFFDSEAASTDTGKSQPNFEDQYYNNHPMPESNEDFPNKNVIVAASTIRTGNVYDSYNPTEEKLDDQKSEAAYDGSRKQQGESTSDLYKTNREKQQNEYKDYTYRKPQVYDDYYYYDYDQENAENEPQQAIYKGYRAKIHDMTSSEEQSSFQQNFHERKGTERGYSGEDFYFNAKKNDQSQLNSEEEAPTSNDEYTDKTERDRVVIEHSTWTTDSPQRDEESSLEVAKKSISPQNVETENFKFTQRSLLQTEKYSVERKKNEFSDPESKEHYGQDNNERQTIEGKLVSNVPTRRSKTEDTDNKNKFYEHADDFDATQSSHDMKFAKIKDSLKNSNYKTEDTVPSEQLESMKTITTTSSGQKFQHWGVEFTDEQSYGDPVQSRTTKSEILTEQKNSENWTKNNKNDNVKYPEGVTANTYLNNPPTSDSEYIAIEYEFRPKAPSAQSQLEDTNFYNEKSNKGVEKREYISGVPPKLSDSEIKPLNEDTYSFTNLSAFAQIQENLKLDNENTNKAPVMLKSYEYEQPNSQGRIPDKNDNDKYKFKQQSELLVTDSQGIHETENTDNKYKRTTNKTEQIAAVVQMEKQSADLDTPAEEQKSQTLGASQAKDKSDYNGSIPETTYGYSSGTVSHFESENIEKSPDKTTQESKQGFDNPPVTAVIESVDEFQASYRTNTQQPFGGDDYDNLKNKNAPFDSIQRDIVTNAPLIMKSTQGNENGGLSTTDTEVLSYEPMLEELSRKNTIQKFEERLSGDQSRDKINDDESGKSKHGSDSTYDMHIEATTIAISYNDTDQAFGPAYGTDQNIKTEENENSYNYQGRMDFTETLSSSDVSVVRNTGDGTSEAESDSDTLKIQTASTPSGGQQLTETKIEEMQETNDGQPMVETEAVSQTYESEKESLQYNKSTESTNEYNQANAMKGSSDEYYDGTEKSGSLVAKSNAKPLDETYKDREEIEEIKRDASAPTEKNIENVNRPSDDDGERNDEKERFETATGKNGNDKNKENDVMISTDGYEDNPRKSNEGGENQKTTSDQNAGERNEYYTTTELPVLQAQVEQSESSPKSYEGSENESSNPVAQTDDQDFIDPVDYEETSYGGYEEKIEYKNEDFRSISAYELQKDDIFRIKSSIHGRYLTVADTNEMDLRKVYLSQWKSLPTQLWTAKFFGRRHVQLIPFKGKMNEVTLETFGKRNPRTWRLINPFITFYRERLGSNEFLLQSIDKEFCLGAEFEVIAEDCESATTWKVEIYEWTDGDDDNEEAYQQEY